MAVIQGSSYSPSFEHVCSPKTVRTFKALYMLKCLSKSKSNLIFFPGILYKALGQCGECHSDWCEQQRWSDGILPAFLWKTAPEPKAEKATHLWVLKAISVASRMTSGPAKGLGWRSHLSGISFQLDRKAWQNFTQENLPYCPPRPSVVTFYQFLWIHRWNAIQRAECFALHREVCNLPTGAAQQMLQEAPGHEPWCPLDGG